MLRWGDCRRCDAIFHYGHAQGHTLLAAHAFPHLRTLDCLCERTETAAAVLVLVSPSVQTVTLSTGTNRDAAALKTLLKSIFHRMPFPSTLTLHMEVPARSVGSNLAECITSFLYLATINIPRFYLTQPTLEALATLPLLRDLQTDWFEQAEYYEQGMDLNISSGSFVDLKSFLFTAHLRNASSFLSGGQRPQLTILGISTPRFASHKELYEFCTAIAMSCPRIEEVALKLFTDTETPTVPISFEDFEPLLQCSGLHSLEITHDYPMTLKESDITKMGAAWPELAYLHLCYDPYIGNVSESTPSTSLTMMSTLIKALPTLTGLGIYCSRDLTQRILTMVDGPTRFKDWKSLQWGYHVSQVTTASGWQSSLPVVEIVADTSVYRDAVLISSDEEMAELSRRKQGWKTNGQLLKVILHTRQEAQRYINRLREEMQTMKLATTKTP